MTPPEPNDPPTTQADARSDSDLDEPSEPWASRRATVGRNALTGYLPLLVSTALGLFLTPIFVRALSKEAFGLWSVGLGVIAYFGILDAGVGTAIVTRVGHAVDEPALVQRITRTATAIYVSIGLGCALGAVGLASLAPTLAPNTSAAAAAGGMIIFLGLWQSFNLIIAVPSGALQGSGRYSAFAVYGAVATLVTGGAQAVAAVATHNVASVAATTALCGAGAFLLTHVRARKQVRGYVLSVRGAERTTARSLYNLGWKNAIISIAGTAGYGSDVVIVGFVAGTRAAAIYAIASRAGQFAIALGTRAAATLTGSYATLSAGRRYDRMWRLYLRSSQASLLIYLPIAVGLVGFGRGLLVDWVGSIGNASYPILVVITVSGAVQVAGHSAFILIMATEESSRLIRFSIMSAVLNVAISIGLTARFGAIGTAYGSLITACLIDAIVLPFIAAQICGANAWTFLPTLRRQLLPLFCAVIVCIAVRILFGQQGAWAVVGGLVTTAAFFVGCLMSRRSRAELRNLTSGVWRRD